MRSMKENADMSDTSLSDRDANGRFVTGNAGWTGRLRSPVNAVIGDFDRLGMAAGVKRSTRRVSCVDEKRWNDEKR